MTHSTAAAQQAAAADIRDGVVCIERVEGASG